MNYSDYILETLDLRARTLYPDRPDLQAQFKIGFLTARLSDAMRYDSVQFYRYKAAVEDRMSYIGPAARG